MQQARDDDQRAGVQLEPDYAHDAGRYYIKSAEHYGYHHDRHTALFTPASANAPGTGSP